MSSIKEPTMGRTTRLSNTAECLLCPRHCAGILTTPEGKHSNDLHLAVKRQAQRLSSLPSG